MAESKDPVGGRSVGSFSSNGKQARTKNINVSIRPQFEGLLTEEELRQAEQEAQLLGNAPRIVDPNTGKDFPFGATEVGLSQRKQFRQGLAKSFLSRVLPTIKPGQTKAAQVRIQQIDDNIAALKAQKNPFAEAANKPGVFAGDPLDIARSNFDRARNVKIAELTAERDSLAVQSGDKKARQKIAITDLRGKNLHLVVSTLRQMLSLPQFSGDRDTNPTLKVQVNELSKIQAQRAESNRKAEERLRQLKAIEADTTLTPSEKAKRVDLVNRATKGTTPVTNEAFEATRAGFASSLVNLNTSRTTRSVQEFIDIGRRIRAQIMGDNEQP